MVCFVVSLRVLNDSGEGETSGIIAALDFVAARRINTNNRPSVVSMSLGGPCEKTDCSRDSCELWI